MSLYRYFGLLFGRYRISVALTSAHLPAYGDHAAVWAGVNGPNNSAWVQGGVEMENGDATPYIYIEIGRNGAQVAFHKYPTSLGQRTTVKLRRNGSDWQVTAGPHTSPWVHVPSRVTIDAMLETYGKNVTATGKLGLKTVKT